MAPRSPRSPSGGSSSETSPVGKKKIGSSSQEHDDRDDFEDFDGGTESGYETDPVDRFFRISAWQTKLTDLQGHFVRASSEVGGRVREIRQRQQEATRRLKNGQMVVVGNLKEKQQRIRQRYEKQITDMRIKLDKVLAQARSAKARQIRHMACFVFSMVDLVITAYWLGASPDTSHLYYTCKCVWLIGLRAIWYRFHGWHYYLFDLCYCTNGLLLAYLWLPPHLRPPDSNETFFTAVYGFAGVCLNSVVLFRNSFVPHSLDRVTSVHLHVAPVLQMWALRRHGWHGGPVTIRESIVPSCTVYAIWATGYILDQFIIERKRIERKGFATLFSLMAYDMGILKKLPESLQGPFASRCVFVVGHFGFFLCGLPFMFLPSVIQTLMICFAVLWSFKNGAQFYMTYFYKVYDQQIHAFELQMKQMEAERATASKKMEAERATASKSPLDDEAEEREDNFHDDDQSPM